MLFQSIREWYQRKFSDPHVIGLVGFIFVIFLLLWFFGGFLAPVLIGVVLAYLLEWPVERLTKLGMPRRFAVFFVFFVALLMFSIVVVGLAPLLYGQTVALLNSFPRMLHRLLGESDRLFVWASELFPFLFKEPSDKLVLVPFAGEVGSVVDAGMTGISSEEVINPELLAQSRDALNELLQFMTKGIGDAMGAMLSFFSLSSVILVIKWGVYLVLIPILVFFFLYDKEEILKWFVQFIPKERNKVDEVWSKLKDQIGNYIGGKVVEIFIMTAIAFVMLVLFEVRFSFLLALMIGFSVLIPYVGATVVTIPLFILGFAQFGWDKQLLWVMLSYAGIQMFDGNVLVPVIFSKMVHLHPIAIIVSILIFGGLGGFWGVFFAIPLATLVQAIIKVWPSDRAGSKSKDDESLEPIT